MLKVENLTKVYPNGTQALKNVSFEVKDGEFLAVIGLSGSGKSTLLRCINRLIEPTSGKIYWNDQDITAASAGEMRKIRRQIGMVFQQFNLVKRSSVMTNVLSGRLGYVNTFSSALHLFSAADNNKALASLDQVGLADKSHVRADSLSGGQQQRVGIARALMQDPKLILADEPVASLDPVLAHSILKYLEQLNKERGLPCFAVCISLTWCIAMPPAPLPSKMANWFSRDCRSKLTMLNSKPSMVRKPNVFPSFEPQAGLPFPFFNMAP